jgi:hypothetical protein
VSFVGSVIYALMLVASGNMCDMPSDVAADVASGVASDVAHMPCTNWRASCHVAGRVHVAALTHLTLLR